MNRNLVCACLIVCCLAIANPAHAIDCHRSPMKIKCQTGTASQLFLPIQLFVTVTQKPVVAVGKSLSVILRQILIGQTRTKGMPVKEFKAARI